MKIKASQLKQIIREEVAKELKAKYPATINLNELLGLFNKKPTPPPVTKPQQPTQSKSATPGVITIEGISANGKGYSVWKGPNPIGDLRQKANQTIQNNFGVIKIGNNTFDYYLAVSQPGTFPKPLQDHVGRRAYFTVSAVQGSVPKDKLKQEADVILEKNKQHKGIMNY